MSALILLSLSLGLDAQAKRPAVPVAAKVPSIEEVVEAEGFTPTPSQSDIYKPGSVLVPNGRGGHDVVVSGCIDAEPEIAIMSQSSIATTLSGGVSARLGVARGGTSGSIEKRLSFVDPEQRTIPLAKLRPTGECVSGVQTAGSLQDLSSAIVLHDVLVAIIKNSVCTKADASGGVVALGEAEAAAYSECVTESDGQVPLGYKALPLSKVLAVAGGTVPAASSVAPSAPAAASASVNFGSTGGLGVEAKLKAQRCDQDAQAKGEAARSARVAEVAAQAKAQATAAWDGQVQELTACAELKRSERDPCISAVEAWLSQAQSMVVSIPAGEESVETACGPRQPAFPASSQTVAATEVPAAAALLARLKAADAAVASPGVASASGESGYAMNAVPAGTYTVGCTAGQSDCERDEKKHKVTLTKGVLMGQTEVTQGLYASVMGKNPSHFSSCGSNCPVEKVSWFEAVQFANALSKREGLEQCYQISGGSVRWPKGVACTGYRLPTEAEWEVAARGGKDTLYAGGDELTSVAWFSENSGSKTHPVGQKQANGYGLYDMSGNVYEWCWDWYGGYSRTSVDPVGPQSGSLRVYRGGSWLNTPRIARAAFRGGHTPDGRYYILGLRLVRTNP